MRFRILYLMFIAMLLSLPAISFASMIGSNSLLDQKTSVVATDDEQGDDGDEDLQDCFE